MINVLSYPVGKWEPAQSRSAAGEFTTAAGRAAVTSGAPEGAKRLEKSRRAQEREDSVRELRLELDKERNKEPVVKVRKNARIWT